jgi:hypothetical protein
MVDKDKPKSPPSKRAAREERLAAALRANLKRRKAQARGRDGEESPSEADKSTEVERKNKEKS